LADASTRINELTISVTSLTGDKRRMEADFQAMHADLDESISARRAAEERADRLQLEVNRLTDELRQEQDNFRNADAHRKQLEVEIREITIRLEEAEAFAQKEGKRLIAKLQAKVSMQQTVDAKIDRPSRFRSYGNVLASSLLVALCRQFRCLKS
jgi:chromosome segregation ATPase